jgi:hypothetical protein
MGRHAGILGPELGSGIHIIMERSTAKTMDAFVEFNTRKDAEAAARRLSFTESGRYPRLGTRHVDITLSSQDELLHDLFPRAKCVQWQDGMPKLLPNTDHYSAGFQGFLTSEEIRGLVSHALVPARVCIPSDPILLLTVTLTCFPSLVSLYRALPSASL